MDTNDCTSTKKLLQRQHLGWEFDVDEHLGDAQALPCQRRLRRRPAAPPSPAPWPARHTGEKTTLAQPLITKQIHIVHLPLLHVGVLVQNPAGSGSARCRLASICQSAAEYESQGSAATKRRCRSSYIQGIVVEIAQAFCSESAEIGAPESQVGAPQGRAAAVAPQHRPPPVCRRLVLSLHRRRLWLSICESGMWVVAETPKVEEWPKGLRRRKQD